MIDILTNITDWVVANSVSYSREVMNIWKCRFHRQDKDVDIDLTIMAFDLYLGERAG